jgi:hypothetical protein
MPAFLLYHPVLYSVAITHSSLPYPPLGHPEVGVPLSYPLWPHGGRELVKTFKLL